MTILKDKNTHESKGVAFVLFLDRDGTLILEPPDHQVDALEKVHLVAGVIPALLKFHERGYRFVMVSNQDGLGSEAFPAVDFERCFDLGSAAVGRNYCVLGLAGHGLGLRCADICAGRNR